MRVVVFSISPSRCAEGTQRMRPTGHTGPQAARRSLLPACRLLLLPTGATIVSCWVFCAAGTSPPQPDAQHGCPQQSSMPSRKSRFRSSPGLNPPPTASAVVSHPPARHTATKARHRAVSAASSRIGWHATTDTGRLAAVLQSPRTTRMQQLGRAVQLARSPPATLPGGSGN